MKDKKVNFRLTKHASAKISQRDISLELIEKVVLQPEMIQPDKYDESLVHMIRKISNRYLRIIGKWLDKDNYLVVSAFYDRRLKKGKHDKD